VEPSSRKRSNLLIRETGSRFMDQHDNTGNLKALFVGSNRINKSRKTYICPKLSRDKHPSSNKCSVFPNLGSSFEGAKELRLLSDIQLYNRRKQMLLLVKQAKHDRDKLAIMRDAAVGTITRTDWIWNNSSPYIRTHYMGFLYYWRKPNLTCFDQAMTQLVHCHSTYLLKLEYIKRKFLDIERRRQTSKLLRLISMATAP